MNQILDEVSVIRPRKDAEVCDMCGISDGEAAGEEEEDAEAGVRKTKKLGDPVKPKAEEVLEHEHTHLPFRSWCRHCVKGRGKEMPHTKTKEKGEMMEVSMDFAFVGEEGEAGNTLTVLVVKERHTGMTMATVVPSKSTGRFVTERVLAFLQEIGGLHGDIVMKSDQEPAIKVIAEGVARLKAERGSGRVIPEYSPVGSSASNGMVERGIQSVQAQMRVMKSALEGRWGGSVATQHPVMPWLAEYAAHFVSI